MPAEQALTPRGHAIECRIYAEDPDRGFLPSPGLVRALTVPGGPSVRDDRGVAAGFEIPVFYDSLIAKLVVWGENRESAIARLRRALERVPGRWGEHHAAVLPVAGRTAGVQQTPPSARRTSTVCWPRARDEPFCEPTSQDEQDAAVAAALAAWFASHRATTGPPTEDRGTWRRAARLDGLR